MSEERNMERVREKWNVKKKKNELGVEIEVGRKTVMVWDIWERGMRFFYTVGHYILLINSNNHSCLSLFLFLCYKINVFNPSK
jgi:hypothetical protein